MKNLSPYSRKQKEWQYIKIMTFSILMSAQSSWASSPFAPLPLHMSGETKSSAPANVALVLDNSGSMHATVESDDIFPSAAHLREFCRLAWAYSIPRQIGTYSDQNVVFTIENAQEGTARCEYKIRNWWGWQTISLTNRGQMYFCPALADLKSLVNKRGWDYVYHGSALAYMKKAGYSSQAFDGSHTCLLPDNERKSRIDMLKETMYSILDDSSNSNIRWGVNYINNYENFSNANPVLVNSNTKNKVYSSIQNVVTYGGTPFTQNYALAAYQNYIENDAIQYACQKNFIIGLTDGDSNGTENLFASTSMKNWFADHWKYSTYYPVPIYSYNTPVVMNSENGLSALSSIFYNQDLKTRGTDKEGTSWNDEHFPTQNIATYTINFGNTKSVASTNYLQNGATHGGGVYYTASNASQLSAAFRNILTEVNTTAKNATVTPSVAPSATSTNLGAITLTIDLNNSSSNFQFNTIARASGSNTTTTGTADGTKSIAYGTLTNNNNSSSRRVLFSASGIAPKFFAPTDITWSGYTSGSMLQTATYNWLIRHSSMTDSQIGSGTLRIRDQKSPTNRMMGDVVNGSILQVGDVSNGYSKYLISAANDGMLHILQRQDGNTTQPFALKLNWILSVQHHAKMRLKPFGTQFVTRL